MAERGILFSGEMVRAVRDGRKTQTRRIAKDGIPVHENGTWRISLGCGKWQRSPYGATGDHLYVREAWRSPLGWDHEPPRDLRPYEPRLYLADGDGESEVWGRYRHARFMPRALSRIRLRVTEVRVERVQAIDWVDIRAEGVTCPTHDFPSGFCIRECPDLRGALAALWDSINGKRMAPKHIRRRPPRGKPTDRWERTHPDPPEYPYAWAANPWVWAISFEVMSSG